MVIRREWPWGLAFIRDSGWTEPVPIEWVDQDLVLARGGEIVAKILHQTDGEATVEVTLTPPSGLVFVSRCVLDVPSGTLVVTDAAEEQIVQVSVAAGRWDASVWMDRADHPSRIALVLRRGAPEDST